MARLLSGTRCRWLVEPSVALSPRLSLRRAKTAERSGSFRRRQCRQLIGARPFTRTSRRPQTWSVVRRGREARADLTRERAAGSRRVS